MFKKLVLATHNKGKVAEMLDLLKPYGIDVVSAGELGLAEPAETENTFVGNALIKARAAASASGLPVLADDSGLCVNALNGDPGVYSADWAGNPHNSNRDFNVAMNRVWDGIKDTTDKSAYFISVFALALPDGTEKIFEGRCMGQIVWPQRGQGGHGYDPIFMPDGETRTFGEMTLAEKQKYSHRARAFEKFVEILK
jgi:XTP/dITP diphosphohydrolase